jgi:RNA polymerase sigma factor (sigma-70 family)
MGPASTNDLIRYLRRATGGADGPGVTDAHLLERFAAEGDEAAFELLVRRHGPMVLGVCRRVLADAHETEDAFQATFLILARKAASAARHGSAGGWLYTVAYRVALRARARRSARAARERPLDGPVQAPAPCPESQADGREVRRVIDEELSRLPEKYRVPFVLCHLEGQSSDEVARELGRPAGTVRSWLTRARERLRDRLARRGLTPASALFAGLAPRPAELPPAATRAALGVLQGAAGAVSAEAAALAGEVIRALAAQMSRTMFAVLLLAAAAVGAVGLTSGMTSPKGLPEEAGRGTSAGATEPAVVWKAVKRAPLRGSFADLSTAALSPDGATLACGTNRWQVKLCDLERGTERSDFQPATRLPPPNGLPHEGPVNAVAFSPDGKALATGGVLRHIRLWDVASGGERATLRGHTLPVVSMAFSPDGRALALATGGQPAGFIRPEVGADDFPPGGKLLNDHGEVRVWDLVKREERVFFASNSSRVWAVAFSPDGKTLASGGGDGTVRLWDAATGKQVACWRDGAGLVKAVAFSPDGKTLAAVTEKKNAPVKLWDLASGRVRARLHGQADFALAVAFSPDGVLATAAVRAGGPGTREEAAGEVRLWGGVTGRPLGPPLTCDHCPDGVAFGGRGKVLAAWAVRPPGDSRLTLWDLRHDAPP